MKKMPIEDLLRWAYRDELPKEAGDRRVGGPMSYGSMFGRISEYSELLTLVDAPPNRWGVVPFAGTNVMPHPDAVAIGEAVQALDAWTLDLPDDWSPLSDMPDLGTLGAGAVGRAVERATVTGDDGRTRRLKTSPSFLLRRCAILAPPDWHGETPEVKLEMSHGKPRWFRRIVIQGDAGGYECEVDGYNARRKRPYDDAYQKSYLDPDPTDVAVARAEYEVWHAALELLVIELDGVLSEHVALATNHPARPWEGEEGRVARILPDLRPQPQTVAPQAVGRAMRRKVSNSV